MGTSIQFNSNLSPSTQRYVDESIEAGRLAIQRMRALAGLEMGTLPPTQVNSTSSVREIAGAITGVKPAELPAPVETIMKLNPRDGREFNLFDAQRLTQSYGPTRYIEEEPLIAQHPRKTLGKPMTGDAIEDRSILDKIRRVTAATIGNPLTNTVATTEEERQAIRAERKQALAGIGEGLVESINNVMQAVDIAVDPGAFAEFAVGQGIADATGTSPADKLQKRQAAARLEVAQRMMNNIDEFRRNASRAAAQQGMSQEQIKEAETWGRNTGYMIGLTPLAAMAEVGIASRLAAATTGLSARSILASPILRHAVAGAGANMAVVPFGSPFLPDTPDEAGLTQQAEDFFLTPNYAGAAALGAGLGAAGAWFALKVADYFRPKQNRNLPVLWDETRGYVREPDPNLAIPEADYEFIRDDYIALDEGYVFGQRAVESTPSVGPIYSDTPASARPIAGLLTDGSERIGFVGDPNGPIFPAPARDVTVNPFTADVNVDASVDVTRNRSVDVGVDVGVDATWQPPKPRNRSKTAVKPVPPIDVEDPIAVSLSEPPAVDVTVEGMPGRSIVQYVRPETQPLSGPISTVPSTAPRPFDFGGLPELPPVDVNPFTLGQAGLILPEPAGPMIDLEVPNFGGIQGLEFDFGFTNNDAVVPTTNAPAVIPTADPVIVPQPSAAVQQELSPQNLGVQETVDLSGPITVPEQLEAASMEPEAAALITVDEEATVPTERMRMPETVVTGADVAKLFGSTLTNADGQPLLVYGVGNADNVRMFNENGTQSLVAGRGAIYFTDNPGDAGGFMDQQYAVQEIGGQLFPAPTTSAQPVPNVTNSVRQAMLAAEQTRVKIDRMKRRLAVSGTGGNASVLRQQINAAETLLKRQQIPESAVTPMYVVSRRHLDLNEGVAPEVFELMPDERTPTEDIMVAALEQLMRLDPNSAKFVTEKIIPKIEEGNFAGQLGARDLYNLIAFNASGETMTTKGGKFNKALQALGVDAITYTNQQGVSFGNSQTGQMGSRIVAVLDPRALVPAYAVDDVVMRDVAALHGTQMSKVAAVVNDPARPDLPVVRSLGDIDFVGSRILVQQNEHVMVRNPDNAFELAQTAKREYPELFVQVVTAPDLSTHVYMGAKPMTEEAQNAYRATGFYPNQEVRDMKHGGQVRRVHSVQETGPGEYAGSLYPPADRPYANFVQFNAIRDRSRYVPSTSAAPTIDSNGSAEWADFQEFASGYIEQLNATGKTEIISLFEPDAAELLPAILSDWFELRQVDNVMQRKALTALFDQQLVQEYRALDPQATAFYDTMRDTYLELTDGQQVPPTIHELASARGKQAVKLNGGPEVVLKDGKTAEMQLFESEPAAREFLENYEPVELSVEMSPMPAEVGQAPAFENMSPTATGTVDDIDPNQYDGMEELVDNMIDDSMPLTREMAEETGEGFFGPEDAPIDVNPGNVPPEPTVTAGGTSVPTNLSQRLSEKVKRGRAVINRSLGWLQPNHSFFAKMEAMLEAAGLGELRPYADTQILKRQQAIALERGNPTYKALEKIRRTANRRLLVNGEAWRVLSLPTQAQRLNYVAKNNLDPSILQTVAQLDAAVDLLFETPAARAAHWQHLVTYINNVGMQQTLNRTAKTPVLNNIFDNAGAGLPNIDWFKAHASQTRMLAETVNPIQMLETIAHSYHFAKHVKPTADAVKQVWRQIGAIEVPTIAGRNATPLMPYADEVLNWISILETGEVPGTRDWVPEAIAKLSKGLFRTPMTVGEAKRFIGLGMSNLTKSFMGWTPAPALRDFTKFLDTIPFTGEGAVRQAISNFVNPNTRRATFQRLKDLGVASTENELQAANPYLNTLLGSDEIYSSFTDAQIRRRQAVQAAADAVINATPARIRDLADTGMYAYIKANALSRALSAEAARINFEAVMGKYGLAGMSGADVVNMKLVNPKMFADMLDDLRVTTKASARLIDDMLSVGKQTEAMTEYIQHVVAMSQGMYGPLHTGKAFRTLTGRMGLMFQNFSVGMLDMAQKISGLHPGARKMGAVNRAKFAVTAASIAGGVSYFYKWVNDKYGYDVRNWSYWNQVTEQLPVQPGPIPSAITSGLGNLQQELGMRGGRYGNSRFLETMAGMALPMSRPATRYLDLYNNARQSDIPTDEVLDFILTNRSGVNQAQINRQANELLQQQQNISNGGGAF